MSTALGLTDFLNLLWSLTMCPVSLFLRTPVREHHVVVIIGWSGWYA